MEEEREHQRIRQLLDEEFYDWKKNSTTKSNNLKNDNFKTRKRFRNDAEIKNCHNFDLKKKGAHVKSVKSDGNNSGGKDFTRHKNSAFKQALQQYKTKQIEQTQKREDNKKKKEEINAALQKYRQNKSQKLKRMSKKTKKGQPIMKYWIENLLEKIQSGS